MRKWAKRITTAAPLVLGGAVMAATVPSDFEGFRQCEDNEVLYNPSTDAIAVYYSPIRKYLLFPVAGPLSYLARSGSPEPYTGNTFFAFPQNQWLVDTGKKVNELR